MQCPDCHFENESTSTYCERCGKPLQNVAHDPFPEQIEYQVSPPPPLNGHNPHPLRATEDDAPPPDVHEWGHESSVSGMSTPLYSKQRRQPLHRPGLFSGILYFIGVIIVTFELFAILVYVGAGATIGLIGILIAVVLWIVSIVLFIRLVYRHTAVLRWWQRILWLVGLTVAAFVLLIINALIIPSKTTTNAILSCVILLYGLAWCFTAIW